MVYVLGIFAALAQQLYLRVASIFFVEADPLAPMRSDRISPLFFLAFFLCVSSFFLLGHFQCQHGVFFLAFFRVISGDNEVQTGVESRFFSNFFFGLERACFAFLVKQKRKKLKNQNLHKIICKCRCRFA